ncbi:peptidoglycan-binding domain-containing protein [Georgenia faecalis]|uniref:peptidoglycan-binding domain-containing protein n=1 Tax=Georgenia faecalis TaxID=2483799 RepID=UPI000FD9F07D|nr:peptidoglycan-binding domain-containing protein [Georgenia faecalis]
MVNATQVIANATRMIGSAAMSGWCEKFVRTSFGFGARYASAKLAWDAAGGKHHGDTNPPAGVPVFWDIVSRANPNHPYDHIALSVGGGYCITTSAGPGRTIAKVRIDDLTRAWGMVYRGWAEIYHGQRVYTAPKAPVKPVPAKPAPGTPPAKGYSADRERAQRTLKALGFYKGDLDGLDGNYTRDAYNAFWDDAAYRPGLKRDGVPGAGFWAHLEWTKTLQRALNAWKGDDIPVDGRCNRRTLSRVGDVMRRNKGGAYRGAVDNIPGPVFCRTLGIPPHPGL